MATLDATITIDVQHMPELIWELRRELADILREEADSASDPRVGNVLRRVAMAFETGYRDG